MGDIEGPFLADDSGPSVRQLTITGERTLPGIPAENYWFQRHVVAYRFAAGLVQGAQVLDAGCGEGYGADLLAASAAEVIGVDLDEGVVAHAGHRYPRARFEKADLLQLPFPDASFDAVVTFQVIEHLSEPRAFIAECARVTRPGGRLILSTPNRLTFSRDGVRNPFHTYEFTAEELRALIAAYMTVENLAGTFHARRIRACEILLRKPFPERLLEQPAPEWPGWLRRIVEHTTERDFAIRSADLARCLDLIAVARR
jgi:2-polyprenyl-3-methyl-5-hydroxy-6-metoxy-1,4-benzoquinol methylase